MWSGRTRKTVVLVAVASLVGARAGAIGASTTLNLDGNVAAFSFPARGLASDRKGALSESRPPPRA
jgi:hypothetical protein